MARIILETSLLLQIIPVSFDKSSLPYLTKVPATLLSLVVPTRLQQPSWLMPTLETPLLFHGRVLISATCVSICELFFFRVLIVVYFKWPHNTGPMLTYLANCGSSPCSQFDITNSRWFKIAQIGRKSPGSAWAQADLSAFSKTVLSISHFIDISFSLCSDWWRCNSISSQHSRSRELSPPTRNHRSPSSHFPRRSWVLPSLCPNPSRWFRNRCSHSRRTCKHTRSLPRRRPWYLWPSNL